MNQCKRLALLALALLAAAAASGQQLAPLSSAADGVTASRLLAEGRLLVASSGSKAASTALGLLHPGMDLLRAAVRDEKPGILVEALFMWRRPEPRDPAAEFAAVYRNLTAIGSLQGIEYWSASRKAWRTFYAESWRVASPSSRERIPDAAPAGAPADSSLFAFQRDLSFGANLYRYDYRVVGSGPGQALLVTQTNLTRMSYGIVPIVGAGGLRTRILIVPVREGLLFYAASAADSPPVPLLNGKLEDSFSNRAEALFKWFETRMGGER